MSASPEFTRRVYDFVAKIPYGKVTTYGHIARAIGDVRGARMVGWALQALPAEHELPCHRVVNRYGYLSGGWHFGHPDVMKERLLAEGVPFEEEHQVDLSGTLWIPWENDLSSASADEVDDLDAVAGGEARRPER